MPGLASFLERLASFSRVISFDKRGTGMSDRVPGDRLPDLETRMEDMTAVMDTAGSEKTVVMGHSEGGALSILFAATHPERVEKLILIGSYAKRIQSEDYPWAPTREAREAEIEAIPDMWGSPDVALALAPSRAEDQAFTSWLSRYMRLSASPRDAQALLRMNTEVDTRAVLPAIRVPTLCIYKTRDTDVNVEEGRWIASQIPGARLVEIDSADHWLAGEGSAEMLDGIEEFVTGETPVAPVTRMLTTVLFTDIVGSTDLASEMGDQAWRHLLDSHNAVVRRELARWRGREISTAGDGSWPPSMDPPARCGPPRRSPMPWPRTGLRSAPAFTSERWRWWATT